MDNFFLFSDHIEAVKLVKKSLSIHFEMKDLGEAQQILQMRIKRSETENRVRTLSISQAQYIKFILEQHRMVDSNLVKTPIMNNLQLPILTQPEVNIIEYQRSIGSLMYLMVCICLDIAYAIGVLSYYVVCPRKMHIQAVKCIFYYLYRTS